MAAVSSLAVSWCLFDRVMIWHDELINTLKASIPIIADYAVRPVFYGINYIAFHFFGSRYESLVLAAALAAVASSVLVYRMARRITSPSVAWLAPLIYLTCFWTLDMGVHAMPHIYVACFGALSLLSLLGFLRDGPPGRWTPVLLGISMALVLLSHGTGIVYVILNSAVLGVLLFKAPYRTRAGVMRIAAAFAVFVFMILVTEAAFHAAGRSYFGLWARGVAKVSANEALRYYWQPFGYYFALLFREYAAMALFIAAVLAAGFGCGLLKYRHRLMPALTTKEAALQGFLVLYGLGAIVILSFIRWKFQRVLVGFGPLLALSLFSLFALSTGLAAALFGNPRPRAVITTGLSIILVFLCLHQGYGDLRDMPARLKKNAWRYSAFYEIARNLEPAGLIGYTGNRKGLSETTCFFASGGSKVVPLGPVETFMEQDGEGIVRVLADEGIRYVVVDMKAVGSRRPAFRRFMAARHFFPLYNWRNILELWRFDPFSGSLESVNEYLLTLEPGTKVGVSEGPARPSLEALLAAAGLEPVVLTADRGWESLFQDMKKRRVGHLILPHGPSGDAADPAALLRKILEASGENLAAREAVSPIMRDSGRKAEIWRILP